MQPSRDIDERIRVVCYCYRNLVEGTPLSVGHFHFDFDMSSPWEVSVSLELEEGSSTYTFGRDLLINPLSEMPEYQDSRDVIVVDYPFNGVTALYFKDFESKMWYPFGFPRLMIRSFAEQTLMVVSKREEQLLWDLQMEAEWAMLGQ